MLTERLLVVLLSFLAMTVPVAGIAQTATDSPDATVRIISQDGNVLQRIELSDPDAITRIREVLQAQSVDPDKKLICVRIRSGASPDGNTDVNRAVSDQRADDTRIYLLSALPELAGIPFIVTSAGEDYDSLRALLEGSDIPGADRAVEIIRTLPLWIKNHDGVIIDGRKKQLKDLRGGETWTAMSEQLFPLLRHTRVDFLIGEDLPVQPEQEENKPANDGTQIAKNVQIFFPVSDITIHPEFRSNAEALQQLSSLMENRQYTDGDIIQVVGMASPEGPERFNEYLARGRAEAIRKLIAKNWPEFADAVSVTTETEAWTDFRAAVQADAQIAGSESDKILSIIDSDASMDAKEAALRKEKSWQRYYRSLFPSYRTASVTTDFVSDRFRFSASEMLPSGLGWERAGKASPLHADQLTARSLTAQHGLQKRTILALKTNLLFDAATMLNYAVEIPLGQRASLVWEHYTPWWVLNNNRICIQYVTLGGEARWWFAPEPRVATARRAQRDRLIGHYLGAYGFWGKVDLQWDRLGCYQCENLWSAGITYGYVFPISRHLNLELSASFGYACIPYQHYIPSDDWQTLWRDTEGSGHTHYFGPTKVQISLVWPLQITTRAKEGARR